MPPLEIVVLSDGRPGHFHLAEGVAAAIARRRPVVVRRLEVRRRSWAPARVLATAARAGVPDGLLLAAGYGLGLGDLGRAGLVVSAGGDTLAANAAASRLLGAAGIFCGTLRHYPPDAFSLVVSSYARHAGLPRHLVALKPSGLDPDTLPSAGATRPPLGSGRPPAVAGLLIGGDSGLFHYTPADWEHLVAFLEAAHREAGVSWIVSTSRRSPAAIADRLLALAGRSDGPIAELIDYRSAGPGTLPRLFAGVEAVLVTEDSSTMMSEAVCARLPVVGVAPAQHDFKQEEREYREFLTREGWVRSLPLAGLTPGAYLAALATVQPLAENHLDRLAEALAKRLPQLFSPACA